MNAEELNRALSFAAACAGITCGHRGADPPRLSEMGAGAIDALLSKESA